MAWEKDFDSTIRELERLAREVRAMRRLAKSVRADAGRASWGRKTRMTDDEFSGALRELGEKHAAVTRSFRELYVPAVDSSDPLDLIEVK